MDLEDPGDNQEGGDAPKNPPPGQGTAPETSGWTLERVAVGVAIILVGIWFFTDLTPLDLLDVVFGSGDRSPTAIEAYNRRSWFEHILDELNGCPVPGTCHGLSIPR